jgi:hypothetical protein
VKAKVLISVTIALGKRPGKNASKTVILPTLPTEISIKKQGHSQNIPASR